MPTCGFVFAKHKPAKPFRTWELQGILVIILGSSSSPTIPLLQGGKVEPCNHGMMSAT